MSEKARAVAAIEPAPPGDAFVVPPDRLLQDWKEAHRRARAYLDALGWPGDRRDALATEAVSRALVAPWEKGAGAIGETLRAVRDLVGDRTAPPTAGDPFLAWRAAHAVGNDPLALGAKRLCSTPELARGRMVPERIDRRLVGRRGRGRTPDGPAPHVLYGRHLRQLRSRLAWPRVAHRRRALLMLLVLLPTTVASGFMVNVLPYGGSTWLEFAIVVFFGALFGWISIGFWTALMGSVLLMRGRDRWGITQLAGEASPASASIPPDARIAVCMPIANEPVDRVFAGLRAIERSLARTGQLDRFHFFVLSDSSDPDVIVREEDAWIRWCRDVQGFGRIFYRRRKVRLARKSGNVADFCRRFGKHYRYMVMLDADSVMRGDTLVRLVELMERHPDAGMVQTVPTAVNRRSLFARAQQFSSRVYGPMFAAGLHFWQLGDGQYWGHNTIIRVQPFMEHCALPTLPGRAPLGGEILSHDFVEAALMGRSGWTLWLAYDLPGSWEEVPSTLLEEMRRDRRWCQGNLQHLRLLFTEGLFGAHRALFLNGALAYVSALLWFAFLTLSTVEALQVALSEPNYFPNGPSLFPEWPVWRPNWAYALLAVIATLLFLPKGLAILLVWLRQRESRLYGGVVRLTASVVLEILLSSLLAPIRMVFHSRFVLTNLLGRTVAWKSQTRDDEATTWREALRQHGLDSFVASLWGVGLFLLSPSYFWWVTPIIGALILAVPTSVFSSRVSVGERARRHRLFLTPEETDPPLELRELDAFQEAARWHTARLPPVERDGFVRATVDPLVNAVRRILAGPPRTMRARIAAVRHGLVERALAEGPASLGPRERTIVLHDPASVEALHRGVWALGDRERAARWGRPGTAAPSA